MASSWKELEQKISAAVALPKRPVAVEFLDAAPAGLERFSGTEPSGCSFWRLAAAGKSFYTVPENHFDCAVGAYTHNVPLSAEREKETEQTFLWCVWASWGAQHAAPLQIQEIKVRGWPGPGRRGRWL